MKKILFNDKYCLTQAVLDGRKTMTRRIVPQSVVDYYTNEAEDPTMIDAARFEVGEVVAIAQSYKAIANEIEKEGLDFLTIKDNIKKSVGWNNKLFVRADAMPHHIKITDIKVERLQDISDEDCLKEGIRRCNLNKKFAFDDKHAYDTARGAFAALIDKVNCRGTWESNPWVFCYEFELID